MNRTAFGPVAKYVKVNLSDISPSTPEDWDRAIQTSSDHYVKTAVHFFNLNNSKIFFFINLIILLIFFLAQPPFKQLSRPCEHCFEHCSLQGKVQLDQPRSHFGALCSLKVR